MPCAGPAPRDLPTAHRLRHRRLRLLQAAVRARLPPLRSSQSLTTPRRSHLCNLDINLTYPQTGGPFPPVQIPAGARTAGSSTASTKRAYRGRRSLTRELAADLRAAARDAQRGSVPLAKRQSGLAQWKQGHSADSTVVDPWYGCDVWDEMIDFAMNFTFPWGGCCVSCVWARCADVSLSASWRR